MLILIYYKKKSDRGNFVSYILGFNQIKFEFACISISKRGNTRTNLTCINFSLAWTTFSHVLKTMESIFLQSP